ncbi:MAG: peptide deformylase [Clostridiales bacterium]|nr:peptide deformylase [Clostridiales bacterium]
MIRPINRDTLILSRKSTPASLADLNTVTDLCDTLRANLDRCVGMAANMIGVNRRIIAIAIGPMVIPMINPVILSKSGPYETEEGCLSLSGVRKTTRYQVIEVEYQDTSFKKHRQTYEGFAAQIIQHEVDHLEGILI